MNVFNLISAGGGSGSGLYLWKKSKATPTLYIAHSLSASNNLIDAYLPASIVYHVLEGDTVTAHTDGTVTINNPITITIDGDTSDTTCYLKYGKYYSIAESTTGEVFVSTLQSDTRVYLSWSGNNHKLFVQGGISTTYPINYYASKNELEFIDYVVSDKEDAYPDGAEQGGFYYERFEPFNVDVLGCTKYTYGTFTPTSAQYNQTIIHNMGIKPKYAFVWAEKRNVGSNRQAYAVPTSSATPYYGEWYGDSVNLTDYGAGSTTNETSMVLYSAQKFTAGITYHYILIA